MLTIRTYDGDVYFDMITGDLASHFGCTVGLKDSVTAVVFVALGTSVPGEHFSLCSNSYLSVKKQKKNLSCSSIYFY